MFDDPAIQKLRETIREASHYQEPHDMKTAESIARNAKLPPSAVNAAITMAGVQPSEFKAGTAHYDNAAQAVILETVIAARNASASASREQREAKAKDNRPKTLAQVQRRLESAIGLHNSQEFTTPMMSRAYAAAEGRELRDDIEGVFEIVRAEKTEGKSKSETHPDRKHRYTNTGNIEGQLMGAACKSARKKWVPRG